MDKENINVNAEENTKEPIDISELVLHPGIEGIIAKRKEFDAFDEEKKAHIRRKNSEKWLSMYKKALENNPDIEKQYTDEILIMEKSFCKFRPVPGVIIPPSHRMMLAVMAVSHHRAREKQKNGLICGTCMGSVEAGFENRIRRAFSQEELGAIIETIESRKEFTHSQKQVIMTLLHVAPKTHIRPFKTFLD